MFWYNVISHNSSYYFKIYISEVTKFPCQLQKKKNFFSYVAKPIPVNLWHHTQAFKVLFTSFFLDSVARSHDYRGSSQAFVSQGPYGLNSGTESRSGYNSMARL